jgi:membrane fusion protein, copper/silver efflux system
MSPSSKSGRAVRTPWAGLVPLACLMALSCSRSHEVPAAPGVHDGHAPTGYAPVAISPEREQFFGVRTEAAARGSLIAELRTVGVVRTDETRESHVHVKWNGWIEEFHVSYVGQVVHKGDPLFAVYSPDLVTAQHELILAKKRADSAKEAGRSGDAAAAASLLDAARAKLEFWDVPQKTIDQVEKSGEIQRLITVDAPRDGTVLERMAVPGMYVEPPMDLYTIADLSLVWVLADLYENEIARVQVGTEGTFAAIGAVGEAIPVRVAFLDPMVNAMTRTVKVRLEVKNEDGRVRPGAYGTVRLELAAAEGIVIASDSVIETGEHSIVFVKTGPGRFEPRHVRLGSRAPDLVQVLDGVKEGEEVVTRAQFLLDSESRLRAATSAGGATSHGAHGGH